MVRKTVGTPVADRPVVVGVQHRHRVQMVRKVDMPVERTERVAHRLQGKSPRASKNLLCLLFCASIRQ
jgi:hypothetical protein